jgi:hypothetical protein
MWDEKHGFHTTLFILNQSLVQNPSLLTNLKDLINLDWGGFPYNNVLPKQRTHQDI